ncbi:MAG: MltA domain-containing protein [Thermodesulfobacteriota bacterium]|nr:MltA domain-containing protein [Thermodesulfobacteriota bacterium]
MQKRTNPYSFMLLSAVLLLLLNACARAPLDKLSPSDLPCFTDDLQLEGLLTGAVRHLHYLNTLPDDSLFTFGPDTYPVSRLRESINSFIDILKQDPDSDELHRIIRENFTVYQAGGRKGYTRGEMLITGYYEPFLHGSLTRQSPYLYPLYAPPQSLVQVRNPQNGKLQFKRKNDKEQLIPYWTRKEIEEQGIAAGYELVYLDNPVDAFILHVQGSGKIQLQDGSVRSVHYAASNGLEYFSIGKLLVDQGKMSLEEASIPSIRSYLREHPDEQKDILYHNIKFIFFSWAPGGDPVGSLGEPLVAGRSIAVDQDVLPGTTLAFLQSRKPLLDETGTIVEWLPMHRFVFPQDTGSAIKGSGRADLYWGNGNYAKQAAGNMKEKGTLYFLVKNDFEGSEE